MKKVLLILPVSLVVLGGFSLAYALSGGGPVLAPGDESMYRDEGPDEEPEVREMGSTGESSTDEDREKVDSEQTADRMTVKLVGRVIDRASKPVENAEVALFSRSAAGGWMNRLGSGERDRGERGRGERNRGERSRGERDRGERGSRERGRRGQSTSAAAEAGEAVSAAERIRSRMAEFEMKKQPGAVHTDEDGRFELQGYFPTRSSFELRVDHEVYVPKTVRRRAEKGKETDAVQDIVLERGAVIAGVVVDEFDRPVPNAEVRLRSNGRSRGRGRGEESESGQRRQRGQGGGRSETGDRGRGRDRGQGGTRSDSNGRRSRGGFGERGGFDFTSMFSGRTRTPSVTSDEKGRFTFQRVSAGKFVARAEADKHLPGTSPEFELEEGQSFGDARVQLGIGAAVSGVVLDEVGNPIANAKVEASWTRAVSQAEAAQEQADPQRAVQGAGNRNQDGDRGDRGGRGGRGGRSGRGGFGSGEMSDRIAELMASRGRGGFGSGQMPDQIAEFMASRGRGGRGGSEKTKTDESGLFALDSLPHAGFRLKVEHDDYIEHARSDVKASDEPKMEIRLAKNLILTGTVVNATTGQPVVVYGIRARSVRDPNRSSSEERRTGREDRGDRRGRRTDENDPEAVARAQARAAEAEARRAERAALQTRVDAYLKQRLGPTGEVPRRTPKASEHPEGKFVLDDLEPGFYAIDVDGPGYVEIAAAVVQMEIGKEQEPLLVQLVPGSRVIGQVVDPKTGKPVKRVRVELMLPPLVQAKSTASNNRSRESRNDRSNRFSEMMNRMRRSGGSTENVSRGQRRLDDDRTDDEGRFELDPQLPGEYLLGVRVDGYPEQPPTAIIVQSGKESDIRVELLCGARVFGKVVNVEEGERVSVVFTHKDGSKKTARVDRRDSTYEIKGLEAGEYFVQVDSSSGRDRGGRGRGGSRGRGGFGSRDSGALDIEKLRERPDLILREGDEIQYNAGLEGQHLGSVKGLVMLNQEPARGLEVRIALKVATPDPATGDSSQRRRGGRRGGSSTQTLRATADREGRFEIEDVPPGEYDLSISRSGRGGGRGSRFGGSSGSALHQEKILVVSGMAVDRQIALQTGRLQLTIQSEETGEPVSRASVVLVLTGEAAGKKTSEWRSLPSYTRLRTRGGKVDSRDIRPGTYSYAISGSGLAETTGQVAVMAGDTGVPTIVTVKKGDGTSDSGRMSEMFGRLDRDGNGQLSKEELGRFWNNMSNADINGDGVISKEEMDAWSKQRQIEREAERATRGAQGGDAGGSSRGGQRGSGSTGRGGGSTSRGGSSSGRGGGSGRRR